MSNPRTIDPILTLPPIEAEDAQRLVRIVDVVSESVPRDQMLWAMEHGVTVGHA